MDKGIIIVGIFVVGLLAGGVFLLQLGNDTEGGAQFIEVPSQPQQIVGDREDIPEPNEGVGRGRQAVELPEGEKILLSPEEEAEIAKEEAEQAAMEAEQAAMEAGREERQRDLEERNAQAREDAIAEAREAAERERNWLALVEEAARDAQREAIGVRDGSAEERDAAKECELKGGDFIAIGNFDCANVINLEVSELVKETEFMFPINDCVDDKCRFENPSIIQMNNGMYHLYINRVGWDGKDDGFVLYTSIDGHDWVLKSDPLDAVVFDGVEVANAVGTDDGGVRIYFDVKVGGGIASAYSVNGIDVWIDEGLIIESRIDSSVLSGAKVITTNNGYRMYLAETTEVVEGVSGSRRAILVDRIRIWGMSSVDGDDWVWDEEVALEYTEEQEGFGRSSYVHSVSDPEIVQMDDGTFLMFYSANGELYSAKSNNGIDWRKTGAVGVKGVNVSMVALGEDKFLVYAEVAKISGEVDRDEATAVGLSWISSFVLTATAS